MDGIGKPRSRLGKWIDDRGITQKWLATKSGLNKNTISRATISNRAPHKATMAKIIRALQEIDPNLTYGDFWDI